MVEGDVTYLQSGEVQIDEASLLSFYLRIDLDDDFAFGTQLSLHLVDIAGRYSDPLFEWKTQDKDQQGRPSGDWLKHYACMPPGKYSIVFKAALGHRQKVQIQLDTLELTRTASLPSSGEPGLIANNAKTNSNNESDTIASTFGPRCPVLKRESKPEFIHLEDLT